MTQHRKIEIRTNGFGMGKVVLDGQDISNSVRGVQFETRASAYGEPDTVILELAIDEIEISLLSERDKTIQVHMGTGVLDTLKRLGWTPPADGATTYRIPHEPVCTCSMGEQFANGHHRSCPAYVEPVCTCPPYELAANDGVHTETCPLYAIDHQSPDAND